MINASKSAAVVEVIFTDANGRLAGKATVNETIRSRARVGFAAP